MIPTAKEFVRSRMGKGGIKTNHHKTLSEFIAAFAIEYAKLHVEAALKAASEAKISFKSKTLQRQEILSAYPLNNIK